MTQVDKLLVEIDQLRVDIEELRKDKARLDWLSADSTPHESMGKPIEYHATVWWDENQTIRSAIDAAMGGHA